MSFPQNDLLPLNKNLSSPLVDLKSLLAIFSNCPTLLLLWLVVQYCRAVIMLLSVSLGQLFSSYCVKIRFRVAMGTDRLDILCIFQRSMRLDRSISVLRCSQIRYFFSLLSPTLEKLQCYPNNFFCMFLLCSFMAILALHALILTYLFSRVSPPRYYSIQLSSLLYIIFIFIEIE